MLNKKVLLLKLKVTNYQDEIIKAMEKKGMQVTVFDKARNAKKELDIAGKIMWSLLNDFKIGIFKKKLAEKEMKIYKKYIEKLEEKEFDYIFDCGMSGKINCISALKERYSTAKYILYFWDDLKYSPNVKERIDIFDEVYVYNKKEAEKYNLKYRANFYTSEFVYGKEEKEIDVFYRGLDRGKERGKIMKGIDNEIQELKNDMKLVVFKENKRDKELLKYYTDKYESVEDLAVMYKKSKILLDISYKNQVGLGLRPFEAIGCRAKLITTNKKIAEYDFYNENNIFILEKDLSNISKLREFVNKEYLDLPDKIMYKYSVDGFMDEIFI